MRVSSATCTLSSSFSISGLTATAYYTGCGTTGSDANPADTTGRIPDFGVSDVAPYMFQNPYNVEPGASALSKAELAKLTSQSVYALMFGVAVTDSVPDSVNVLPTYADRLTPEVRARVAAAVEPEPARTQRDLRAAFLAGHVEHRQARR